MSSTELTPALEALLQRVEEIADARTAITAMLHGLADQFRAVQHDPDKIEELCMLIRAHCGRFGLAAVANAIAAPVPTAPRRPGRRRAPEQKPEEEEA
jgi:hypothetical protein